MFHFNPVEKVALPFSPLQFCIKEGNSVDSFCKLVAPKRHQNEVAQRKARLKPEIGQLERMPACPQWHRKVSGYKELMNF